MMRLGMSYKDFRILRDARRTGSGSSHAVQRPPNLIRKTRQVPISIDFVRAKAYAPVTLQGVLRGKI